MTETRTPEKLLTATGIALASGIPLRLARRISDSRVVPAAFAGPNGPLYTSEQVREFLHAAAKLENCRPRAFHC